MALFKNKPIIWVSGPDKGGMAAWLAIRFAVRRSGGRPIRVTPSRLEKIKRKPPDDAPHALILGGGADIDPERYEDLISDLKNIRTSPDENEPGNQRWATLILAPFFGLLRKLFSAGPIAVDVERDNMEWRLLEDAINAGIPVLGICRGAQLMNVFHSGTLYQDLAAYYRERPNISTIYPRKEIRLKTGSRLSEIFGVETVRVNSLHNQAVKNTGKGIQVSAWETAERFRVAVSSQRDDRADNVAIARPDDAKPGEISKKGSFPDDASPDEASPKDLFPDDASPDDVPGVAQGIEHVDYPFMIGVQWHPEYLPQVPSQRHLFDELVRCAILRRDTGAL